MTEPDGVRGRIITFYSYKGGTGRSMAVANTAWLLAMAGHKVLAIDWDLEAPGLHRYFHPFLPDPDLSSTEGVIDFAIRYTEEVSAKPVNADLPADWYAAYSNISHFAVSLDYAFPNDGVLDFIPAGRQGDEYATRVNSFNWRQFYEKLGGRTVIESMRQHLTNEYEFVLVDSRTGVSDTSGICTVDLPDRVVVCFTLNMQSVNGASLAARSMLDQTARRDRPVSVFPIPMRVESTAEKIKYEQVSGYAKSRFLDLLRPEDVPTGTARDKYWSDVEVPYIGFYAFEEQLGWFLDAATAPFGVLASIKRLTRYVAGIDVTSLSGPDDQTKAQVLARYGGVWSGGRLVEPITETASIPRALAVYVSYNLIDREFGQFVVKALSSSADFEVRNFGESRAMLILSGPAGLSSVQLRELAIVSGIRSRLPSDYRIVSAFMPGALARNYLGSNETPVKVDSAEPALILENIAAVLRTPAMPSGTDFCPYPGLRPYRVENAALFHGRDVWVDRQIEQIRASRQVVIGGPPGVGKTSAVFAGIVPRLLAVDKPGQTWKIAGLSLRGNVWDSLAAALVEVRQSAFSAGEFASQCTRLADELSDGAASRADAVTSILATSPKADRLLIVVDDAGDPANPDLTVLQSLAANLPVTLLAIADAPAAVPCLSREEMRSAIEGPAQTAGLMLGAGLADAIINDLESEDRPLPLLQMVLVRVWERREYVGLTLAGYESCGKAKDAVERWAEAQVHQSQPVPRERLFALLSRFVIITGEGAVDLRPVNADLLERDWLQELATFLASGFFVQSVVAGKSAVEYRIADRILIDRWPQFLKYIKDDTRFLVWRDGVSNAARNSSISSLLRGFLLEYAKQIPDRYAELTAREREFVQRSIEEQAAAEQLQRATERQHTTKRTRNVFIVLCAVLVILVIIWFTRHDLERFIRG